MSHVSKIWMVVYVHYLTLFILSTEKGWIVTTFTKVNELNWCLHWYKYSIFFPLFVLTTFILNINLLQVYWIIYMFNCRHKLTFHMMIMIFMLLFYKFEMVVKVWSNKSRKFFKRVYCYKNKEVWYFWLFPNYFDYHKV